MRYIGTQAKGIRLPIINKGDPLAKIVTDHVVDTAKYEGFSLKENDIVAVTEAIVAKAQGNYATLDQVASDIRQKYPSGQVGVVFPILSRNRFFNILKSIVLGAKEVFVLLSYPADEVGNPIMDIQQVDEITDSLKDLPPGPIPANKFRGVAGNFKHPFTGVDYIDLYESAGTKVYLSTDPRDILQLTPHVLVADIHSRFLTQRRLKKDGAKTVYALSDILNKSVEGSGFNPDYGIIGSNISTTDSLKLFPRDCDNFVLELQKELEA